MKTKCVFTFCFIVLHSSFLLSAQPARPTLVVTNAGAGGALIRWLGSPAFSSQLEHGRDFVEWSKLDLPAPETASIMSSEIPPYLLTNHFHFFRLARRALITSPIPTTPGFYTNQSLVHGGIARNYFLGIPAGWTAATNWPVMFALPAHGESITEFVSNHTELLGLANTNGWILVFAEATAGIESYRWFSYDNPNATQPYVDDAAFLFALVEELKASGLQVNSKRVYAAGFSNGGSMVHYLAGKANHPFAAFAFMDCGTAPLAHYREPYNRLDPDSGTNVLANVPLPWQPRPALLMNMTTDSPWPFEGRGVTRGARHNVARWTQANGFGGPVTNGLGVVEPPATPLTTTSNWTATGNDRASVDYEKARPDHNWPTNLIANGWSTNDARRFQYFIRLGTNVVDQRLPERVNATYPHTLSPDPVSPTTRVRVDAGTMTVEIWRAAPLNRTSEVIFVGLSDGGHRWPDASDKLPFDASLEVLRFFGAH
jgi:poly(3-hydroxybutyrate) depolymerase